MKTHFHKYTLITTLIYIGFILSAGISNSQSPIMTQEEHKQFLESITYQEALEDTKNSKKVERSDEEWKNIEFYEIRARKFLIQMNMTDFTKMAYTFAVDVATRFFTLIINTTAEPAGQAIGSR